MKSILIKSIINLLQVEDMKVASPATVSRVGMVYLDVDDLGWEPYAEAWINRLEDEQLQDFFYDNFEKWIPKMLKIKRNHELVSISDTEAVITLCKLLDAIQGNFFDIII